MVSEGLSGLRFRLRGLLRCRAHMSYRLREWHSRVEGSEWFFFLDGVMECGGPLPLVARLDQGPVDLVGALAVVSRLQGDCGFTVNFETGFWKRKSFVTARKNWVMRTVRPKAKDAMKGTRL